MRNKLLEAVVFAAEAHKHQKRRGKQGSYICHPLRVSWALSLAGASEIAVIAGVLHDTVEDTEVTIAEIETLFGGAVAEVVSQVTDDDTLPREERKQATIDKALVLSNHAALVKLADCLDNRRDMINRPPKGRPQEMVDRYLVYTEKVLLNLVEADRGKEWTDTARRVVESANSDMAEQLRRRL